MEDSGVLDRPALTAASLKCLRACTEFIIRLGGPPADMAYGRMSHLQNGVHALIGSAFSRVGGLDYDSKCNPFDVMPPFQCYTFSNA